MWRPNLQSRACTCGSLLRMKSVSVLQHALPNYVSARSEISHLESVSGGCRIRMCLHLERCIYPARSMQRLQDRDSHRSGPHVLSTGPSSFSACPSGEMFTLTTTPSPKDWGCARKTCEAPMDCRNDRVDTFRTRINCTLGVIVLVQASICLPTSAWFASFSLGPHRRPSPTSGLRGGSRSPPLLPGFPTDHRGAICILYLSFPPHPRGPFASSSSFLRSNMFLVSSDTRRRQTYCPRGPTTPGIRHLLYP